MNNQQTKMNFRLEKRNNLYFAEPIVFPAFDVQMQIFRETGFWTLSKECIVRMSRAYGCVHTHVW